MSQFNAVPINGQEQEGIQLQQYVRGHYFLPRLSEDWIHYLIINLDDLRVIMHAIMHFIMHVIMHVTMHVIMHVIMHFCSFNTIIIAFCWSCPMDQFPEDATEF